MHRQQLIGASTTASSNVSAFSNILLPTHRITRVALRYRPAPKRPKFYSQLISGGLRRRATKTTCCQSLNKLEPTSHPSLIGLVQGSGIPENLSACCLMNSALSCRMPSCSPHLSNPTSIAIDIPFPALPWKFRLNGLNLQVLEVCSPSRRSESSERGPA